MQSSHHNPPSSHNSDKGPSLEITDIIQLASPTIPAGHQGVKTDNLPTGINLLLLKDTKARLLPPAEVPAMSPGSQDHNRLTEVDNLLEVTMPDQCLEGLEHLHTLPPVAVEDAVDQMIANTVQCRNTLPIPRVPGSMRLFPSHQSTAASLQGPLQV